VRFLPACPNNRFSIRFSVRNTPSKIARDWNAPASGKGYVTRFRVTKEFLGNYEVHEAGGKTHREYWIPAEDLARFNAALVGEIEVIAEFAASR
jgi:hypothetical protein